MQTCIGHLLLLVSMLNMPQVLAKAAPPDLSIAETSIADRMAIRALVDQFSILADRNDVANQVLLFTEDAVLEVYQQDTPSGTMRGRDQLAADFAPFLAQFDQVYHLNGQHLLDSLQGDAATGTSYCLMTLIGPDEAGARVRTTMGVYYRDTFQRVAAGWLIAKRESHFHWTAKEAMGA